MSHVLQVFVYELRRNLRRKGFLFTTFGIPLIAALILFGVRGVMALRGGEGISPEAEQSIDDLLDGGDDEATGVRAIVDLSGLLDDTELPESLARYATEDEARDALRNGDVDGYYVIQEDYVETGEVTVGAPRFSISDLETAPMRRLLLNALSAEVDSDELARLRNPGLVRVVRLDTDTDDPTGTDTETELPAELDDFDGGIVVVYIFAMTLLISIFTTNGYLMQSVIEEKETRLIEILIASVRPVQLLGGKILALGVLGLLQMVVWVVSAIVLVRLAVVVDVGALVFSQVDIPFAVLPLVLLYFVLMYILFAAFFGAIGALSTSMQEGPQLAVVLTLPAVIPLYFTFLFVEIPDSLFLVVLSIVPPMSAMSMVMRLVVSEVPVWQVALSVGLLAAAAAGMIWLAGRLFRVNTLLAGQRPRLRDLPKLVRG